MSPTRTMANMLEATFAEQDAAFFAAMKRGEECDARCLDAVEMCGVILAEGFRAMPPSSAPAVAASPSSRSASRPFGLPSVSQGQR